MRVYGNNYYKNKYLSMNYNLVYLTYVRLF